MSIDFKDMPWVVTISGGGHPTETYGPQKMEASVALRDKLRVAFPNATVEAWAAQAPNPNIVKPPTEAAS